MICWADELVDDREDWREDADVEEELREECSLSGALFRS